MTKKIIPLISILTLIFAMSCSKELPFYTVSFNSDGGTPVKSEEILSGGKAIKPANPEKEFFDFAGWYSAGALYDFNTQVLADLTLTAKWEVHVEKQDGLSISKERNGNDSITTTVAYDDGTVTVRTSNNEETNFEEKTTSKDGKVTEEITYSESDEKINSTKTKYLADDKTDVTVTEVKKLSGALEYDIEHTYTDEDGNACVEEKHRMEYSSAMYTEEITVTTTKEDSVVVDYSERSLDGSMYLKNIVKTDATDITTEDFSNGDKTITTEYKDGSKVVVDKKLKNGDEIITTTTSDSKIVDEKFSNGDEKISTTNTDSSSEVKETFANGSSKTVTINTDSSKTIETVTVTETTTVTRTEATDANGYCTITVTEGENTSVTYLDPDGNEITSGPGFTVTIAANDSLKINKAVDGTTIALSADSECSSYSWIYNNNNFEVIGTSATLEIDTTNFPLGKTTITLEAEKNGILYSATITLVIE